MCSVKAENERLALEIKEVSLLYSPHFCTLVALRAT
jgi:hypothetical protein